MYQGGDHVSRMWTKSSVSYNNFRISDVEEFKKKHVSYYVVSFVVITRSCDQGLQFLPDVTSSLVAGVKRLTDLLKSRDNTNTEIMQYIEVNWPLYKTIPYYGVTERTSRIKRM